MTNEESHNSLKGLSTEIFYSISVNTEAVVRCVNDECDAINVLSVLGFIFIMIQCKRGNDSFHFQLAIQKWFYQCRTCAQVTTTSHWVYGGFVNTIVIILQPLLPGTRRKPRHAFPDQSCVILSQIAPFQNSSGSSLRHRAGLPLNRFCSQGVHVMSRSIGYLC